MDISTIFSVLTIIIAAVGLIFSIYKIHVDRRDKAPRLVAKMSNGLITSRSVTSEVMLFLEVINPGEKPVKVSAVEIKWKKQKLIFFKGIAGTTQIPFVIQPDDNETFWTPLKDVALSLKERGFTGKKKVRACFRTAVGGEFLSKKFPIYIDE